MKSKLKNSTTPLNLYPQLKESKDNPGLVILFVGQRKGVVMSSGDTAHLVGHYSENWSEHNFAHFGGSVEVSNG